MDREKRRFDGGIEKNNRRNARDREKGGSVMKYLLYLWWHASSGSLCCAPTQGSVLLR